MKQSILRMLMGIALFSFNPTMAQSTGKVGGYDTEDTTYYNSVKIYSSNDDLIGKAVFSYDTYYECYNNIKYYNYQDYTGYFRLKVSLGGSSYVNKKIWLEADEYTYLDDVFKLCNAEEKNINVKILKWEDSTSSAPARDDSTGKIGGYDTENTTHYSTVKIYNPNDKTIGKAVFSYDTEYECWNNIKYYNYQDASGYIRLRVWLDDTLEVDKKVWVEEDEYTYLDDVFKHCTSSKKDVRIKIAPWKD